LFNPNVYHSFEFFEIFLQTNQVQLLAHQQAVRYKVTALRSITIFFASKMAFSGYLCSLLVAQTSKK
jgi:hypothetical protein